MVYEELKRDFEGVNVVVPTPFDAETRDVNHDDLRENVAALHETGIRLFMPCAGLGEIDALTLEECDAIVETVVDEVGMSSSVVGGVEGPLRDVLELADAYEEAGADAIMLRPPDYGGAHDDGLRDYYRRVIEAVDIGTMIYKHDPVATDAMVADLADHDQVVAVKYKDDVRAFARTAQTLPAEMTENLVWVNGRAELDTVQFGIEGATAFTTGIGNVVPQATQRLYAALDAGRWTHAKRLRERFRPYQELRAESGEHNRIGGAKSTAAVKHGLDIVDRYGGPTRCPGIGQLSQEDKQRVQNYVDRLRDIKEE